MPMSSCFQVLAFWTVLHQMNLQCVKDMWDFQANMPILLTTLKRAQQSSSTGATADAIIAIVAAEIFLAKVGVDVISKVCHVGHAIFLRTGHFSKSGNRRVIINWYETYIFLFLLCFEAAPRPFVGLVLTNMEKPGKSTLAVAHHCKYDCNVPNSNYSFCKRGTNSQLPEVHIWMQTSQNQSCTEPCTSLHNKKAIMCNKRCCGTWMWITVLHLSKDSQASNMAVRYLGLCSPRDRESALSLAASKKARS